MEIYQAVYFDVNFEAIERTVICNDMMFDLVGNKIFLKYNLPDKMEKQYESENILKEIISEFVNAA